MLLSVACRNAESAVNEKAPSSVFVLSITETGIVKYILLLSLNLPNVAILFFELKTFG